MKLEDRGPYHFSEAGIRRIEQEKGAQYMGYWCVKGPHGWNESPVDVFYVQNPDRSKGHSNYFGMFERGGTVYICDAQSCFSEPIAGIVEGDTVYTSRYRHDYVETPSGNVIDGGRDYIKTNLGGRVARDQIELAEQKLQDRARFVTVQVNGGEFEFHELLETDEQ
jgi:hypothetical protein